MTWNTLFVGGDLRGTLKNIEARVAEDVQGTPEGHVLQADDDAWAEALAERYSVEAPALRRADMWLEHPQEIQIDVSGDHGRAIGPGSGPVLVPGYRVDVHIPFDGDPGVFNLQASQFSLNPPRALIEGHDVIDRVHYPHDSPVDIAARANELANKLEQHLSWSRHDISLHNAGLKRVALEAIRLRRDRVERHREHIAATGLPIGRPDEQDKAYIADALVRLPSPALPRREDESVSLEPVLGDATFEHILGVIRAVGEAMERSPGTYEAMGEEDRRQVIVAALNSHYRGQTTAEAFNVEGKTDILVRHEGANLFIGECKIWAGPKSFSETVDQLFRYTGWRDTKLAIISFVPQRDLTEVIEKARAGLADHDSFVEWRQAAAENELRATMSWPGDERRHADLNVFLIHTPTTG